MAAVRRREGLSGWTRRTAGTLGLVLAASAVGPASGAAQDENERHSSVTGQVVDAVTGRPLQYVSLGLRPFSLAADAATLVVTDARGRFQFGDVVPGRYVLAVEQLGFRSVGDTLDVAAEVRLDMLIQMSATPLEVAPVVVAIPRRPLGPLRGFDLRRETMSGTFLTRDDIEAANVVEFTDLMRTVPGMRVVPMGAFGSRIVMRGCRPDLWLDGTLVSAGYGDIDSFLRPQDLEAVEVYRGSVVPGEFGTTQCGAVVAWSRRGQVDMQRRSIKKQLLFAGSLVALFVLIRS